MSRRNAALVALTAWLLSMAWVASLPVYPSYGDGDCGTSALGALLGRGQQGCAGAGARLLAVWGIASALAVTVVVVVVRVAARAMRRAVLKDAP